jgi:hypothetical protein
MKYSMLVVVVVCVCSIIIGSVQSAAVPQIANETPARAIRNMEDGGVDPNRSGFHRTRNPQDLRPKLRPRLSLNLNLQGGAKKWLSIFGTRKFIFLKMTP